MENKYYIYAHIRKDTNSIFYIGKGCNKRAFEKGKRRSVFWNRIVDKYDYEVKILLENLSQSDAYKYEILYIDLEKKKGNCEANFTKGGDGINIDNRWWGDKISKSLIGIKRPFGIENKSYKDFATKEELFDLYVNKKKTSIEIAKIFNVSYTTVTFRLKQYGIKLRNSGRISKKIICVTDGKIFNSISEASSFYGLYRENISKVLMGKYKKTGKKEFKYLN